MDVDRARTANEKVEINRGLTEEQLEEHRRKKLCFRCSRDGHMSKECPTRTRVKAREAHVEEETKEEIKEEPKATPLDDIMSQLSQMDDQSRMDFLAQAFEQQGF